MIVPKSKKKAIFSIGIIEFILFICNRINNIIYIKNTNSIRPFFRILFFVSSLYSINFGLEQSSMLLLNLVFDPLLVIRLP